ncbi:MAG TPA: helix-hairpin-helix domain-containing protein, partial [Candidatus Glassbacteria bacterium]|nr:helix-hairpin-helix domain-containing protein [Candidatus Glassbacteria bacterium]
LGDRQAEEAGKKVVELCRKHHSEVVAVGNGTAGRETETWLKALALPEGTIVALVDESGASVYSASEAAREEFPEQDVTVRGAVSIGRRLADPLAELVKIDPKSIGVGQYQHDVDQKGLRKSLDDVVVSCVNLVGVELNTASRQLLTYVSGLGPRLAGEIVAFRQANGPFASRAQLLKVPHLGPRAFEQSAGFLRIAGAANPLDCSAVHPESYPLVEAMARDLNCSVSELMRDESTRGRIRLPDYVNESVGLPTLEDILTELARPGRDPRPQFEVFAYSTEVAKIEDVRPGMQLPGVVTNITAFGALVDIGVHQDGLVHISQVADKFVRDVHEVLKLRQKVTVTVLEVDLARKRIALSLKKNPQVPG